MSLFRKESVKRHKYDYKDVKFLRDKWKKNLKSLSLCRENVVGTNDSYDIQMIKGVLRELNILVRAGSKGRIDKDEVEKLNSSLFEAQVLRGGRGPLHSDRAQRRSLDVNPNYAAKVTVRDLLAINKKDVHELKKICRKLEPIWGKVDTLKIIGGNMSFIDGDLADAMDHVDFSITKFHKDFAIVCSNDAKVQKFRGFLQKKGSEYTSRVVQESEIVTPLIRSSRPKKRSMKRKKKKESFSTSSEDDSYYDEYDNDYEFLHDFKSNMFKSFVLGSYGPHLFRLTDAIIGYAIGTLFIITVIVVTAAFTAPFFFFENQWILSVFTGSCGVITCAYCCLCWGVFSGLRSGFLGGYVGYVFNLSFVLLFSLLAMAQPILYFLVGRIVMEMEWSYIHIVFYSFFGLTVFCLCCCLCCSVAKLVRIPFTQYPSKTKGVIRFGYESIN